VTYLGILAEKGRIEFTPTVYGRLYDKDVVEALRAGREADCARRGR
jgi:hypothetical protein